MTEDQSTTMTDDGAESELSPGALALEKEMTQLEEGQRRTTQFNVVRIDEDDFRNVVSFDDAIALFEQAGLAIDTAGDVIGDGIPMTEKDTLVNIPLFLTTWRISRPENESFGAPYIVAEGITKMNDKFRFTDGSTGIAQELIRLTERRIKASHASPNAGLMVPGGLLRSEYASTDAVGNPVTAVTFHISTK